MLFAAQSMTQVLSGSERRARKDEIAARLAEVPKDTRDLTGRLCGDPLPGRSYLEQINGH